MIDQRLFQPFLHLLEEENAKQNLIRYQTREELIKKHLEDSLLPFTTEIIHPLTGSVLDIGSGGGFPAIPLAIAFPNASFTLIESEGRKAAFLKKVALTLNLSNVSIVNQRVEDYTKVNRECYDFCTMRAVAATRISLEYAAPALKVSGELFLYKGPLFDQELIESKKAIHLLGFVFEKTIRYTYSYNNEWFTPIIACFKKVAETPPNFPRRPGMPKKYPL
ncbi:MAG TPA: 16S rRNA (guanine(527)-N(7))-methyltransferase RsmG [Thermotogota bacterium]|nr:16S rRNA (guanine(527)-N(7))-methyltransferase RsmG [Thermotogota bacterium]HRW35857.1 16S rRNA (guanine(527)-N(7))-methyltransferase RsmG [Thermotogota bacterium]